METRKLAEITPYDRNPRKNDGAVDRVLESLNRHGQVKPIVLSAKGKPFAQETVVAGHTTLRALERFGAKEAFVVVKEFADEAQFVDYNLRDNKTSEFAEWDEQELANLSAEFDISLDEMGFEDFDIEEESEGNTDEDAVPEVPEEPTAKLGQMWKLGDHRLMCGDSTDRAQVEALMGGEKADMVHTDPPYGVDYSNAGRPKPSKKDLGKIKNDNIDLSLFLQEVYKNIDLVTKDDVAVYIWYADKTTIDFYLALDGTGINFAQMLIWKKPMLLGRNRYQYAHEPCMFAVKGSPYQINDRTKTTVWDFGGYDKSKNVHPTQKPVFIPEEAIMNSSKNGDAVLDLFGGSGSTLIACEKTGRKCRMMELDPKYCDVIIKRWEDFTGKKAELL
jgi:DNA modification methylase